jgi:DNA helicase-2/ATP-dependent DNA helicase PcrA
MDPLVSTLQAMVDELHAAGAAPAIFGHMRVASGGRERDLLLGSRTVLGPVTVLDWRTAPLAEVFFRQQAGEAYELDVDGRAVAGRLIAKHRVRVSGGAVSIGAPASLPPPGATSKGRSEIVLDAQQRRAVELDDGVSLIVDGEAGVGKTVVAMYRLAMLRDRAIARGARAWRALVLVPTEGLRRLCRQMAERIGVGAVEIALVDEWLVARAREAFTRVPDRLGQDATAATIRLKRHPAVRTVLREVIDRPPARDDDERKLAKVRGDLLHLWGDRDRLARVLEVAGGALEPRSITDTLAHTHVQFTATTEQAHRHVDADRLVTVDGRAIDDGTPTEDAGTIDIEDVPVMFELARLRGKRLDLGTYDHIVIDEAQLVAPMELAAIADALRRGGSITVAGDHRQETDDSAWFAGWDAAMRELRVAAHVQVTLETTYRSVPAIATFARALATSPPAQVEPSAALAATVAPSELEVIADLCDTLEPLLARDHALQVAIVAQNPAHAIRLHRDLSRGLDATLVLDGAFTFTPGVIVTTAAQVQGLEFDAVVIPDLSPERYRATPGQQRSLYVSATRARSWLWLITTGEWSPLVTV